MGRAETSRSKGGQRIAPEAGGEELRAAAEGLSRISHELKTPLVTIKGYAELLLDQTREPLSPQHRDWVRRIAAAANRLDSLFRRVTGEDRAAGGWSYHARAVRPGEWIGRCVDEARALACSRALDWSWGVAPGTGNVSLDSEAGRDLLLELLQNAARATPDGGRVRVEALAERRDGREGVRITVSDSGMGVPAGPASDPLFEKFFVLGGVQGHHSGDYEFQSAGLGLGLSLVRGVARAHGGEAWAEGTGRDPETLPGSRFHVWLPASAEEAAQEAPAGLPRGRLLVVDPDPEVRRILAEALSESHDVVSTGTGAEALAEWARETQWVGCVLEPDLPDRSGVELVRALRAVPGRDSAVLIVYGAAEEASCAEALRVAGADVCLWKPVRARVILQRLESVRARKSRR